MGGRTRDSAELDQSPSFRDKNPPMLCIHEELKEEEINMESLVLSSFVTPCQQDRGIFVS